VNEDCHSALDCAVPLFVVADGVGGGALASRASRELVRALHDALERAGTHPETFAPRCSTPITRFRRSIASDTDRSGAATVALCKATGTSLAHWVVAWVGDCRVYRVPAGDRGAELLTVDDTYRHLREEPPYGGSLDDPARMVGNGAIDRPNVRRVVLRAGEMLVLCSDGVHKHADPIDIARVLRASVPLARRCMRLIEFARASGKPRRRHRAGCASNQARRQAVRTRDDHGRRGSADCGGPVVVRRRSGDRTSRARMGARGRASGGSVTMKQEQIERVFGARTLKMATGEHVEVFREAVAPGERRRTPSASSPPAMPTSANGPSANGASSRALSDTASLRARRRAVRRRRRGGMRQVQTYDAGVTVDQWATLLPFDARRPCARTCSRTARTGGRLRITASSRSTRSTRCSSSTSTSRRTTSAFPAIRRASIPTRRRRLHVRSSGSR
jgi:serine/threonine protein phosphatase PrpC